MGLSGSIWCDWACVDLSHIGKTINPFILASCITWRQNMDTLICINILAIHWLKLRPSPKWTTCDTLIIWKVSDRKKCQRGLNLGQGFAWPASLAFNHAGMLTRDVSIRIATHRARMVLAYGNVSPVQWQFIEIWSLVAVVGWSTYQHARGSSPFNTNTSFHQKTLGLNSLQYKYLSVETNTAL